MRAPAGSFCKAGVRFFCARPTGRFCKTGARYFCARPPGPFAKQECAFLRAPAGSFCKAGVRFFAHARQAVFVKQGRAFCARRAAALPRLSAVRARPSTARSGPHSLPPVRPVRTPAFPSSWLRFLSPCTPSPPRAPTLLFALLPPRAPTLPSVFSVSSARPRHHPLFHTVRPAAAPVSPCAAGLTRRGCGPGFRACVARFCGLPRAVGGGGRTLPHPTVFCKKEETRHRGFARAALHESGRGCEYYRRGE